MRRLAIVLTAALGACAGSIPFNEAYFKGTHNSYSGGKRGGIVRQLDAGIRQLELDIVWTPRQSFQIGHGIPGWEVDHENGNPQTNNLGDWLDLIAGWCARHPNHVPLTLVIDAKNDLREQIESFDALLRRSFGEKLFTPKDLAAAPWPTVDALRGRVVVVLSGHHASRQTYWHKGTIAFAEYQAGNAKELEASPFYSSSAGSRVPGWTGRGKLVRLWRFNSPPGPSDAPVNFPSTDVPFEEWYLEYCRNLGVKE